MEIILSALEVMEHLLCADKGRSLLDLQLNGPLASAHCVTETKTETPIVSIFLEIWKGTW